MTEFAYNNIKNISIGHILFELNCGYHLQVSYKEDVNPRFRSLLVEKLILEPQKLMLVCQNNVFCIQKFQKQSSNKEIKTRSYARSNKVG